MQKNHSIFHILHPERIRVAVCGHLPTACNFLLHQGVVQIDQYEDAADIPDETSYDLILIYAPNAEGILDTVYSRPAPSNSKTEVVPIRLLNEPACDSALLELKSMIRRITNGFTIENEAVVNE